MEKPVKSIRHFSNAFCSKLGFVLQFKLVCNILLCIPNYSSRRDNDTG